MAKVIIDSNESLDSALKRFKKKVDADNIMGDLKKKEFYISKGEKRRKKIHDNQRRLEKLRFY